MGRLTIKDKEVERWGNLLPKTNFAGDENIVGIQLADNLYTAHKYYVGKAVDKLSELEDVLEEFGIESAEELKARLQSERQLHTQAKEIVEKIKDLSGDYFYENNQNDLLLTGTDFTEILDEILKEYGGE